MLNKSESLRNIIIKASLLKRQNKFEASVIEYNCAIQLNPRFGWLYYCLGGVLFKQRKLDDALVAYQKAFEINKESALCCYKVGEILEEIGDFKQALQYYQQAYELNPNHQKLSVKLENLLSQSDRKIQSTTQSNFNQNLSIQPELGISPLMVSGLPRSGTTIFMHTLAGHPSIVAHEVYPYETRFSMWIWHNFDVLCKPQPNRSRYWEFEHHDQYVERNPFYHREGLMDYFQGDYIKTLQTMAKDQVKDFYSYLSQKYHKKNLVYFLEKFPGPSRHVIRQQYKNYKEIYIMRHPIDVYLSQIKMNLKRGTDEFGVKNFKSQKDHLVSLIKNTSNRVKEIQKNHKNDHFLIIKYEELIQTPSKILQNIFKFLDLDHSDQVISVCQSRLSDQSFKNQHSTKEVQFQPTPENNISLAPSLLELIQQEYGEELEALGYKIDLDKYFDHDVDFTPKPSSNPPKNEILNQGEKAQEYIKKATVCSKKNQLEKAIQYYQKAIDLSAVQPAWVYLNLGNLLLQLNQLNDAEAIFTQLIQKYPNTPGAFQGLAHVAEELQKWEQALVRWDTYLKKFPSKPWVQIAKANVLIELGCLKDAETIFKAINQDYPNLLAAQQGLDRILQQQNQSEKKTSKKKHQNNILSKLKFTIYGNCQANALAKILMSSENFSRLYEYVPLPAVMHIQKDQLEEVFPALDLLVYQPISSNLKGAFFSSEYVCTHQLKNTCSTISIPSCYFQGYYPELTYMRMKDNPLKTSPCFTVKQKTIQVEYTDLTVLSSYLQNEQQPLNQYQANAPLLDPLFYDHKFVRQVAKNSIQELVRREAEHQIDIKVSQFIKNEYQVKKLFYTINHPSFSLFHFLAEKLFSFLQIKSDFNRNIDPLLSTNYPVSNSIIKGLDIRFQHSQKYIIKGLSMKRLDYVTQYYKYLKQINFNKNTLSSINFSCRNDIKNKLLKVL